MFFSPCFFPLAVPALLATPPSPPAQERLALVMGTRLTLHLEGTEQGRILEASEAILTEMARIEAATSTWRPDSAWSRLNAAGGEVLPLDREWIHLLAEILRWNRETEGAFDPVLGALMKARAIRTGGRVPSAEELAVARAASGSALLKLDEEAGTARLLHPRAAIEEGGFLKGYALDTAARVARAQGAQAGLLDFGGQFLAWGRPFEVDIASATDRQRPRLRLRLDGASLSGSGCSERGRHILDPRTGEPCQDWGATAVVADRALDADVLSTALFVLGPEHGFAWAEARGIAAAFLFRDGSVRLTRAFQRLNPTNLSPENP